MDVLRTDLWCVCPDEPVSVNMAMRGMEWVKGAVSSISGR